MASGTGSGPKALPGSFPFYPPTQPALPAQPASWFGQVGTIQRAGSLNPGGTRFAAGEREYGVIMTCTVRDTSC